MEDLGEELSFSSIAKVKKKTTFRKKNSTIEQETAPSAPAAAPSSSLPTPNLSFTDESTTESILTLRKSKQSRKMAKEKRKREKQSTSAPVNTYMATSAGEYTAEKLNELKEQSVQRTVVFTPLPKPAQTEPEPTPEPLSPMVEDDEDGNDPGIPTEEEIRRIKEKRKRMQAFGLSELEEVDLLHKATKDLYKHLGDVANEDDDDYDNESRLVRESVLDDDEAEVHEAMGQKYTGRIQFGDPGKQSGPQIDPEDFDQNDDEETQRWILEQLKRSGLKRGMAEAQLREDVQDVRFSARAQPASTAPVVDQASYPSLSDIIRTMQQDIQNLQTKHASNQYQLNKVRDALEECKRNLKKTTDEQTEEREALTYFEDLKNYILDLLDCLGSKLPNIDEMEREMLEITQKLARARTARAAIMIKDDLDDVREILTGEVDMSKMDREIRRNEREAYRSQRKARRQRLNIQEPEGWSSDEDDDDDISTALADYKAAKDAVLRKAANLFDDVYEEFCDIKLIAKRFEDWKRRYPKTYSQAYVGLSLPQVFTPFARLELLDWDPLKSPVFDHMNWYTSLINYGLSTHGEAEADGDDAKIIPRIVAQAVAPLARKIISLVWDPFSYKQTVSVIELIKELEVYLTEGSHMRDTLVQVQISIQSAVEKARVPLAEENTNEFVTSVCLRQFWRAVKLLRNACLWVDLLPVDVLLPICSELINMKLLPFIRQSFVTQQNAPYYIEKISAALPAQWLNEPYKFKELSLLYDLKNRILRK